MPDVPPRSDPSVDADTAVRDDDAAAAPPSPAFGRRGRSLARAATILVLLSLAAGWWLWSVDAVTRWSMDDSKSLALPEWAVGWYYVPSQGFGAMARDDRYGKPVALLDGAGRPIGFAAAVTPAWRLKLVERRPPLSWLGLDDVVDGARPAPDEVHHAYDVRILGSEVVTVTVRGADRQVLGRFLDNADMQPLSPHLFPRDNGPIEIAADGGDLHAVVTETLRSVADGTAIQARTSDAAAEQGGVRLEVTHVAAWPGGVAVALTGGTARPRDRVIVTTAPFEARAEPAAGVLTPTVRLRDDKGRLYPLLAAEAVEPLDHHWWWNVREDEVDPFAAAAPDSSINLPATLRFGPVADDVRSLALEVEDVFVVVGERHVPYSVSGNALLSLVTRSWGDVVTLPLPWRPDHDRWAHPDPERVAGTTSGTRYTRTLAAAVEIGGSRAVVEMTTTKGDSLAIRLRPTAGGFGRLLAVNARQVPATSQTGLPCDRSMDGAGWGEGGRVRIEWPTVTVGTTLVDPTADSARVCFESPLLVVEGRWTLPLAAADVAADQRTNGTGAPPPR